MTPTIEELARKLIEEHCEQGWVTQARCQWAISLAVRAVLKQTWTARYPEGGALEQEILAAAIRELEK